MTNGEYVTNTNKDKEILNKLEKIKLLNSQLNKKINKMEGVALLTDTFNMFYMIPLKHIITEYENYESKWISLKDILRELNTTKGII